MKLEGQFVVEAPKKDVWELFMDPQKLAGCVPGCEEIHTLTPTQYDAVLTVKVQFMTIKFKATGELKEATDERLIKVEMVGKPFALAGLFRNQLALELTELESNKTQLTYEMDLQLSGRLASLGEILMRGTVEKSAAEFADNVKALFAKQDA